MVKEEKNVTFRRYVITDLQEGFHITNRKHPLEAEGADQWLIDLVYENCRLKRQPVTVVRHPYSFQLEADDESIKRRFGLVDYYALIDTIAQKLMRPWTPPDVDDDDEHIDKGPTELRQWHNVRKWAISKTAASVNKMVYDKWKVLRDSADPVALSVQKKVFSAAFGYGSTNLVATPDFYDHRFIVKDVLEFRAAAVAAGLVGNKLFNGSSVERCLEWMTDWRKLFSSTGETYRILDKTLTNVPPGIPAHLLIDLNRFILPRSITSRLELLTVILANRERQRNIRVFSFATEAQIVEAMRLVSDHLHRNLSHRRWHDLDEALTFIGDYPDQHIGNIVGLAERSIRWHRDLQHQTVERVISEYGDDKELAKPTIPLPTLDGLRFLSTVRDLVEEGSDMGHCIASYAQKAACGHSYLFHVDWGGERASVEVDWCGHVVQSQGPRNEKNKASEWGRKVLAKWGRGLKKSTP